MKTPLLLLGGIAWTLAATSAIAADQSEKTDDGKGIPASAFSALKARSIGPALMSGRIGDFAVNPNKPSHYFAAVCSGGVWKTVNAGVTWTPVFDSQGSYSIGCLAMDPANSDVIWVGTGENNSQRSVSFGDGVYRTRDGGKNWEHLGLKESEHIGMIAIHPENSEMVYVAAQGPLWRSGGDRGLYKTSNAGKTWKRILHVSDDTGINEVHLDLRDPNVIYASAYQRRRHVWTLINGGPESAIYKSTDGGATWRKLTEGIPEVDKGRIGLDISPANPDIVYAIIEAAHDEGGFFRSADRGETWEKRSDYMSSSPQYYNEIVCDPVEADRVYALDTFLQVTDNGGKSFSRIPGDARHVDDHALWIDPDNNDHLLVGCDGGVYDSYDRGTNWRYKENLPVTQFYRVSADNSKPFYYVYGGTQDNSSQGGPSRTTDRVGITSADWFVTVGGDGYETVVDPEDPNIVYSLWQYGGLVRHDRRSGEITDIKPREAPGDSPLVWNWDSPLILSPHNRKRLYFAADRLLRSNDQGNSWEVISGDLTRGIDRNTLPIMDRIQPVGAVSKHLSTSIYGNAVALTESPLVEGLLYVGTDDGLVHVTSDSGENWRKFEKFYGVPEKTYVSTLTASGHQTDTVYAGFDNHKMGDFTPYLMTSTNRGVTWTSIIGDLPEHDVVYSIQEDHANPELLFVGTEFGAHFTIDRGKHWTRIKGLPTIAVRDIEIQRRESDLILGTFGRGIYILDDYSPLRHITPAVVNADAHLFPIKAAVSYVERSRLGGRSGRGFQGATLFAAPNPTFGAVMTYHLKEDLQTRKERRLENEKNAGKEGKEIDYPTLEETRAEQDDKEPSLLLVVRDAEGNVVRRVPGSRKKGLHRVAWDLRYPSSEPIRVGSGDAPPPWANLPVGPLAAPGTYSATLVKQVDGEITEFSEPVSFDVTALDLATFASEDKAATLAFQMKVARLQRAVEGVMRSSSDVQTRLTHITEAIRQTPGVDEALLLEVREIESRLKGVLVELRGDPTLGERVEPAGPSIRGRVGNVVDSQWHVTSPPTRTERDAYRYAGEAFSKVLEDFRTLVETDLSNLEAKLEAAGAPWTPGRIPMWEMERAE